METFVYGNRHTGFFYSYFSHKLLPEVVSARITLAFSAWHCWVGLTLLEYRTAFAMIRKKHAKKNVLPIEL